MKKEEDDDEEEEEDEDDDEDENRYLTDEELKEAWDTTKLSLEIYKKKYIELFGSNEGEHSSDNHQE